MPWIIAACCLLGAGFIAWGSARLRMIWPLLILSLLLAAIALQLRLAAQGRDGFHDLAAVTAQAFTLSPALLGVATGLGLAFAFRHRLRWRSRAGGLTLLALLTATVSAATTFIL
ncbi:MULTISPECIES: hypothetical protein [unclassified Paracoccus (in: a-proteobacteria)]|uniref:hypothetical protein n=1 Tax=unclassified Paracoccus (in: a-proteobacteria) TaxID=2688777 RepID=UPI001C08DB7F|nr:MULTISPECIES: hypothetical protein [unclassified Paracoccus (in: a-proteobacteria)]MBU2959024.1 hypothetical protein [Paracoccus sp. C2R09]